MDESTREWFKLVFLGWIAVNSFFISFRLYDIAQALKGVK